MDAPRHDEHDVGGACERRVVVEARARVRRVVGGLGRHVDRELLADLVQPRGELRDEARVRRAVGGVAGLEVDVDAVVAVPDGQVRDRAQPGAAHRRVREDRVHRRRVLAVEARVDLDLAQPGELRDPRVVAALHLRGRAVALEVRGVDGADLPVVRLEVLKGRGGRGEHERMQRAGGRRRRVGRDRERARRRREVAAVVDGGNRERRALRGRHARHRQLRAGDLRERGAVAEDAIADDPAVAARAPSPREHGAVRRHPRPSGRPAGSAARSGPSPRASRGSVRPAGARSARLRPRSGIGGRPSRGCAPRAPRCPRRGGRP